MKLALKVVCLLLIPAMLAGCISGGGFEKRVEELSSKAAIAATEAAINAAKPKVEAMVTEYVEKGKAKVDQAVLNALAPLQARIKELEAKKDRTPLEDLELYGKGALAYGLVRWLERKGLKVKPPTA